MQHETEIDSNNIQRTFLYDEKFVTGKVFVRCAL